MGWIPNARPGNDGAVGNTLEDLLGIEENNLPMPNAAEWELKTQRLGTLALTTLLHMEPSPRAIKFVPMILLPQYGWQHTEAGNKYPEGEMSFRQTIHALSRSNRGFVVKIDRTTSRVLISFDASAVASHHEEWLGGVKDKSGLGELEPQPYWGFDDLQHRAGTKLPNSIYVQAEVKKEDGTEFYKYSKVIMLKKFKWEGFLQTLERAQMLVDFDARTGHNHGTKFRMHKNSLPTLYEESATIIGH